MEEASLGSRLPTGPKTPRSTVLSVEEEEVIVAFRRHTLLPLDDCLYALQAPIPIVDECDEVFDLLQEECSR
jgi:hypothetical protein